MGIHVCSPKLMVNPDKFGDPQSRPCAPPARRVHRGGAAALRHCTPISPDERRPTSRRGTHIKNAGNHGAIGVAHALVQVAPVRHAAGELRVDLVGLGDRHVEVFADL